jgi:hypothetical protein
MELIMNYIKISVLFTVFLFSAAIFANGVMYQSSQSQQVQQVPQLGCAACSNNLGLKAYAPQVSVTLYTGSLKDNIRLIARQNGWPVIWGHGCNIDYRWFGHVKVVGASFQDVLRKILVGYPLQAVFYKGNHVIVIKPRTLK